MAADDEKCSVLLLLYLSSAWYQFFSCFWSSHVRLSHFVPWCSTRFCVGSWWKWLIDHLIWVPWPYLKYSSKAEFTISSHQGWDGNDHSFLYFFSPGLLQCSFLTFWIKTLQTVQNAAARILAQNNKRPHITLYWLPISFRIQFKMLVLTFRACYGQPLQYIADLLLP